MRLFVALPVAGHVRTLLAAALAPLQDAAPTLTCTRPGGWHVTLAFCGEVPDDSVAAVEAAVAGAVAGARPVTCHLGAAAVLGRGALAVEVVDDPPGSVVRLGADVQEALAGARLPVQERAVRPHLTVARASRRGARLGEAEVRAVAPVEVSWEVDAVELVRSHLGGGPARYEVVATWPLRGG